MPTSIKVFSIHSDIKILLSSTQKQQLKSLMVSTIQRRVWTSFSRVNHPEKPEKQSIVELKNGKVVFKQKPISLDKHSETMQGWLLDRPLGSPCLQARFRDCQISGNARTAD